MTLSFSYPDFSKNSEFDGHEKVLMAHDPDIGFKAFIAIHNTNRGPALGGCRMWQYDREEDAITDVLRLSKGMTYKASVADLPLGGGKSVIMSPGELDADTRQKFMQAMGKAVAALNGEYIIAEDVGTSTDDMAVINQETSYVCGIEDQSKEVAGDPSPVTAWGTFCGIRSAVKYRMGRDDLNGVSVAVQGLGHVGYYLCQYLHEAGASLVVSDINEDSIARCVNEFGATAVMPDAILSQDVDVFAPCALGAILNAESIPTLKAKVIAGAANNQLLDIVKDGNALEDLDILYAPDYVINAGGLINVAHEYVFENSTRERMMKQVEHIGDTLTAIFEEADRESLSPAIAADRIAEQRFGGTSGDDDNVVMLKQAGK